MSRALLLLVLALGCRPDAEDDPDLDLSLAPLRSCEVVLAHDEAPDHVGQVSVAGRFNAWEPMAMTRQDDGSWARVLGQLQPGTYAYKVLYDGEWQDPPPWVYTTWEGGFENRALVVGDCRLPELHAEEGSASSDGTVQATFRFTRGEDGAPLDPSAVQATVGGLTVQPQVDPSTGLIAVEATGLGEGKHSVRVQAADTSGRAPESGQGFLPLWVEDEPYLWQSGLLYYLFLDRFRDGGDNGLGAIPGAQWGTDYMGGDLVGARQALEEGWFDELGVTSIWLSPVNQNPPDAWPGVNSDIWYTGYHGYWPTRAREVEDRLGTLDVAPDQALHDFVQAAHARGIRVLLDVVLNHVHEDHEFLDLYPDWFTAEPCVCTTDPGPCNWNTNPIGCWFTDYLPDLDYRNQAIVDRMVDDMIWWIETFDVDGFRIDAAKHMDHVILRTLSMRLKERYEAPGGAKLYLVGETFVGQGGQGVIMDYVAPWELDGQFDFPLVYPLQGMGAHGWGWAPLAAEVQGSEAVYGPWVHWMSPFMGNHDIPRYATEIAGCPDWQLFGGCHDLLAEGAPDAMTGAEWDLVNRLAISFAFVATQPGVPLLYYGDEIGLAGGGDPDNRRMMIWEDWSMAQATLFERVAELGRLRNEVPALQLGERRELWVDHDLYVYARDLGGGEVAIIGLHSGYEPRTTSVPIPSGMGLAGVTFDNALPHTRSATVSDGHLQLTLDPWEYVVLLPR